MKRSRNSRNLKNIVRRRILFERLEARLSPALLTPGVTAEAFSDFQGNQVGPVSNTDPNHTIAEAVSGPVVNLPGLTFQESGYAEATKPSLVLGRSLSGGIFPSANPNTVDTCSIATTGGVPSGITISPRQPINPTATVSCSLATATSNWIVAGVAAGTLVDIDVQIQVSGFLDTVRFGGPSVTSSVAAGVLMASDVTPYTPLLVANASLTDSSLQTAGPWTFSQVQGRYETNHTSTATFTFPAGEPFSLQAALGTLAESVGPFESFAYSDFSTSGMTHRVSTSAPGATVAPVGAGGTVAGYVWQDLNANEVQEGNESRLAGLRVFLDVNQNGVFDAVTEPSGLTNANGAYSITGLPTGTYDVTLEVPSGWEQTSPLDTSGNPIVDTVSATDGVISSARPFGVREIPGMLTGVVWHDLNVDGIRDAGEPALSDWIVYLDANDNGVRDANELSARSQIDGSYVFASVSPGNHSVAIELPSDWTSSTPEAGRATVTVVSQQTANLDFGNYRAIGVIEGTVFHDVNGNAKHDSGEIGRDRWIVFLDLNDDGFWSAGEPTRYTDSSGHYRFDRLAPGTHTVAVLARAFYESTTPGRSGLAYEFRQGAASPSSPDRIPAELNGDGATDLILHRGGNSRSDSQLSVLLNSGDGRNFNETTFHTLAQSSFSFEPIAEDLNLDGLADVVVMTNQSIVVLLNDPANPGTFSAPATYLLPFDAGHVRIAQLDDDAYPDFVIGNITARALPGPGLAVLRNNPANPGTFLFPTILAATPQHSTRPEAVDVTGDGLVDIVTRNGTGDVLVLRNDGSQPGSFLPPDQYQIQGRIFPLDWFTVVDVNGDDAVDIVAPTNRGVAVLLNDPANAGQFQASTYLTQGPVNELVVADWTGDGLLDLVVEHGFNAGVVAPAAVLANQASSPGTFGAPTSLPIQRVFSLPRSGWDQRPELVDLNLDDLPDGINRFGQSLLLSDPNARGTYLPIVTWPEVFDVVYPADLNGDGAIDLLYQDYPNTGWSVAFNDRQNPGQFSTPVETRWVSGSPRRSADFNGDGLADPIAELTLIGWTVGLSSQTTRVDAVVSYQSPSATIDFGNQFDSDRDGVSDEIESLAPNNGDGNLDGTPDREQREVASLPSAVGGSYITVDTGNGELADVQTRQAPANGGPLGIAFPYGLVEYAVEGLDPGSNADVTITFHAASSINSIYKLGATAGNPQTHFYEFASAFSLCQSNCPATFNGNQVTLHLQDGARGDDDLTANGRIVDPVGAAIPTRPTLEIKGPVSGVRGARPEFEFIVTPPGDYNFDIDWDGDGNVDASLSGNETLVVEHVFAAEGDFSVTVTATSTDGISSDPVSHDVSIDVAAVIDGDLVVGGTAGNDRIRFYRHGRSGVGVWLNRNRLGPFDLSPDAKLIAHGQDGNDRIYLSGRLHHKAEFFGGEGRDLLIGGRGDDLLEGGPGNDRLHGWHGDDLLDGGDGADRLFGGRGDNVLVGGEGNDRLFGGVGRDVLIGGTGTDFLYGGFGEDILIGGSTIYDDDHASLREILSQWTLPHSHPERVGRLRDDSRGVYLKPSETVLDDQAVDRLFGGIGKDWFFFNPDQDRLYSLRFPLLNRQLAVGARGPNTRSAR